VAKKWFGRGLDVRKKRTQFLYFLLQLPLTKETQALSEENAGVQIIN